jgi:Domain of unknown function (DUF4382)
MSPMHPGKSMLVASLSLAALLAAGCGNSMSNPLPNSSDAATGQAFVVGTDAPVASVVSFNVQVKSIDAVDSSGNSVPLISGSPTIDFARYNGLQTLLDLNNIPVGTYNSVSITLGTATIGYLNTSTGGAPAIETENATLTNTTVSTTLKNPLVIAKSVSMGLRIDFDLHQSIETDSNGQITGTVNPTFDVSVVHPGDAGGFIDEFTGGVVSVNAAGQSFVIQGPHGEQLTVSVNGQTEWDNNETIDDLSTSSIVEISGTIDNADQTIDADEVAILSQNGFYAGGQITYVSPASGAASSFDLYVRGLEPTTTGLTLGQIATIDLSGNEKYFIYWMHNPLTQFLFNSSSLVAGQHVSIGGPASGAANASAVTTNRVVLRHWGFNGTVVAGSVNSSQGTFQMKITGFAGVLVPTPVTVYVGDNCTYRDGFGQFTDITASANVRVVGLLLKNPTNGQLVLLARYVDSMS